MFDKNNELIQRAKAGDRQATEELFSLNMGLVKKIALKFLNRGIELDDAIQIGCIGLQKAIQKFDFSYEVQFSTYAVPMIMGEIKRFLRDDGTVKVSRTVKENAYKISLYTEKYKNQFFREPKITEIAEALHMETEDVVTALSYSPVCESLYAPVGDDGSSMLMDKLPGSENEEEIIIENMTLHELLAELPPRERTVIEMRYFQEKTQNEVASHLNISQVQVSRIEKKIIETLRKKMLCS